MIQRGGYSPANVRSKGQMRSGIKTLNAAKQFILGNPGFLEFWQELQKTDNPVTDAEETIADRVRLLQGFASDRAFPLETVELQSFNQKHDKDIQKATIHYGPSSDEMARSMNSLAFVLANDIYFRSNKFNPATEEGRKLLAHELTHVAQNAGKENEHQKDLEQEAEQAETIEAAEINPLETVTICGKPCQLNKLQQKKVAYNTARLTCEHLDEQKIIMEERDYLKYLLAFQKKMDSPFPIWNVKTEADHWMDSETMKELRRMVGMR